MLALKTIGPEMVWHSSIDPLNYDHCEKYDPHRDESNPRKTCLVLTMRESGASTEALAFAQLLEGQQYMSEFLELGIVDLATGCRPFMPNTGQQCYSYLVNGTPQLIDVARHIWDIDLKAQPFYRYLELKFPESPRVWDPMLFKTMEQLPQGGPRFVFQARLARGFCRACGTIGFVDIAFNFDETSRFLGTKILSIPVTAPPFSPDGNIVAKTEARSVILWDVATRQALKTFEGPDSQLLSLAFSPDGKILAGGSVSGTIKLWEVATGKEMQTLNGNGPIPAITFSPDGKILASGEEDGSIRFWEVATGEELNAFRAHKHPVLTVAFSPDGKLLASGSWAAWEDNDVQESAVKLWETATGKELRAPELPGYVVSVVFSPNGKLLATGFINGGVWEVTTGNRVLNGCGNGITVAFSPDGNTLASVDSSGAITLCDIVAGKSKEVEHRYGPNALSIAFSPDGKILVSDDGRFWDVATGTETE